MVFALSEPALYFGIAQSLGFGCSIGCLRNWTSASASFEQKADRDNQMR
jgi:hypothetical protein